MSYDQSRVAFVDIEQANAISFLYSRSAWLERPIFSYIEFMVRAAETFYDDGDIALAASISERANNRLSNYCRFNDTGNAVSRPQAIDELLLAILEARLILAFITGHEIGHLLQMTSSVGVEKLFEWIEGRYNALRVNDSNPTMKFERFLGPEVVQKIASDGTPNGFAVQTIKFIQQFNHLRRQQIQEVQSDALGVILATPAAINVGISASNFFSLFPSILEHTDMLMVLRRIVARFPRGEKGAAIAGERSSLFARLCLFVELARGLKSGTIDAPPDVLRYWSTLPESEIENMERGIVDGRLEGLGLRSSILVRGGIEVGLYGALGPPLTPEQRTSLGPLSGNIAVSHAHRDLQNSLFRIEESFEWEPAKDAIEGVSYGFAGAIRDIADLCASEKRPLGTVRQQDILRNGTDASFVELLRSARSQVVARRLDTWHSGFEHVLRHPQ